MSRTKAGAERPGLDVVVADGIRQRILDGMFKAGDHLVEVDFAKEFAVSNGTVRSALRHLQGEGLVEFRPRRGMFVATLAPGDALELCSLRDALESLAARLAADVGTKSQKDVLRKIMVHMRSAVLKRDRKACVDVDLAFHRHIVDMSGHRRLGQIYGLLGSQIELFMALTEPMHADLFADMIPIHEPIVQAILSGDGEKAAALSAVHNQKDGRALAESLAESLAEIGSQKTA